MIGLDCARGFTGRRRESDVETELRGAAVARRSVVARQIDGMACLDPGGDIGDRGTGDRGPRSRVRSQRVPGDRV